MQIHSIGISDVKGLDFDPCWDDATGIVPERYGR
jgi:hypothetical protein